MFLYNIIPVINISFVFTYKFWSNLCKRWYISIQKDPWYLNIKSHVSNNRKKRCYQQQTQLFQDSSTIWYVLLSTVNNQSASGKKSKSSVPAEQHLLKNWGSVPKKQPWEAGRGSRVPGGPCHFRKCCHPDPHSAAAVRSPLRVTKSISNSKTIHNRGRIIRSYGCIETEF